MTRKPRPPRERIARALCRLDGHPENITMDGEPMWRSYDDEAIEVLAAVQVGPLLELLSALANDDGLANGLRERCRLVVEEFNGGS